jgi:hypothetical protein
VLLAWGALLVASAELVSAVGRLPNQTDLHYLFDPQFMENSPAAPSPTLAALAAGQCLAGAVGQQLVQPWPASAAAAAQPGRCPCCCWQPLGQRAAVPLRRRSVAPIQPAAPAAVGRHGDLQRSAQVLAMGETPVTPCPAPG